MTTTTQDDFLGQCVVELGGLMLDGSDSWFPLRVRAPFQFTPLSLPPSLPPSRKGRVRGSHHIGPTSSSPLLTYTVWLTD